MQRHDEYEPLDDRTFATEDKCSEAIAREFGAEAVNDEILICYADPTRPARRKNAQAWELAAQSSEWGARKLRHVPTKTKLYHYAREDERKGTRKARTLRERELRDARKLCDEERALVDAESKQTATDERRAATLRGEHKRRVAREGCGVRRAEIRARSRGTIEGLKEKRREAHETAYGPARPRWDKRKRQTAKERRAESDSQAEHSIPDNLIEWWRKNRASYPYDLPHDERAARFLEDVESQWGDIQAAEAEKWDGFDYAAAEAAADDERRADAEAVPF